MLFLLFVLVCSVLFWFANKKRLDDLGFFSGFFLIIFSVIFIFCVIIGTINVAGNKASVPELKSRIAQFDIDEQILRDKIETQMKDQCASFADIESSTKELAHIVTEKEEYQDMLYELESSLRWNQNVGWLFHFNLAGAGKE